MLKTRIKIRPSKGARQIFNLISARSGDDKTLTRDQLESFSKERQGGRDDALHLVELIREGWVAPTGDGGVRVAL